MLKQSAIADAVPLVQKQVQQTLFFAIAIPITECRLSYIVLFKFVIAFLLVLSCLVGCVITVVVVAVLCVLQTLVRNVVGLFFFVSKNYFSALLFVDFVSSISNFRHR